ncbi:MAG: hypothetical protein WCB85_14985 [Candidatus Dormiibacterota bacterium]
MEMIPGPPKLSTGPRVVALACGVAVAGLTVTGISAAYAGAGFPTSAIADYAVSHYATGTTGGQCIIFAEQVVDGTYAEHGLSHTFEGADANGYYAVYAAAGAQLVGVATSGGPEAALSAAQRGDIIQLSPLSPSTSATPWFGGASDHQHTAVLLGAYTTDTEVIDSNWDEDGLVRVHPLQDVLQWAERWGLELAVWSFGLPSG